MPDRSVAVQKGARAAMAPAAVTGPLLRCSGVDGFAREFNSAWLSYTGRPLQSVLREGWLDDVHPDDRPRCVAIHAAMSNQRRAYTLDFRLRNGAAGYRWMMEHATPLLRPDGTFHGYAHHCMDVHERTTLSEELAARTHGLRLNVRQHGRFAVALARELAALPADRARDRLLTMARLADGPSTLDRTRFRLADWIDAAIGSMRLAPDPPSLSIDLPAESIELDADRTLLTKALADVLAEAAAPQPKPRVIELRAARTESLVLIDTPAIEASSAFALLACAIQLHGGEVLTLPDDAHMRLCLPFVKRRR